MKLSLPPHLETQLTAKCAAMGTDPSAKLAKIVSAYLRQLADIERYRARAEREEAKALSTDQAIKLRSVAT